MLIKSKYKIARRVGAPIYEKTQNAKFALRESRRGKKEPKHARQRTDFGNQLTEKQKARYTYGMNERQFSRYVKESVSKKGSKPGEALYARLEMRLDNVVYRLGFAPTRMAARQMVTHGHIRVNNKKAAIPSFEVRQGDAVTIREVSAKKPLFATLEERLKTMTPPSWIKFNHEKKEATIQGIPKADRAQMQFNIASIIEFYSR